MSILIDRNTRVLVQGITGRDGSFHTKLMLEYGTNIVAGVTPGKGGTDVYGIPVFDSVKDAVKKTSPNCSIIFVPPQFAVDAIYESADNNIPLIVVITEGIPIHDMIKVKNYLDKKHIRLIGPNCPGVITPDESKVGIMPGHIFKRGNIGVVSRSGTLTYEIVYQLTLNGLGQSTAVGIGGDPIIGSKFIDILELFNKDDKTEAVVLIGEIGGTDEQDAAEYIKTNFNKPVVAFIAGRTAPAEKRMGHAGAIIAGSEGTAQEKIIAFEKAGVKVASLPEEVPKILKEILK
ncbi:MAG: succinate--CoA ligase subunit alpha [candidate division WOR-3 bacterium]|nr:succinate--CoA ligase subunit alpha [candidate division WOR-3 bacterium]MCX7948223.1 succinate--CoA ligase subunit alpha [candidate division WOR-3 bacterium]MDW8150025.1 succinate--CoA ligase subunit alpha [candidate division WOR-3 bacterium]